MTTFTDFQAFDISLTLFLLSRASPHREPHPNAHIAVVSTVSVLLPHDIENGSLCSFVVLVGVHILVSAKRIPRARIIANTDVNSSLYPGRYRGSMASSYTTYLLVFYSPIPLTQEDTHPQL